MSEARLQLPDDLLAAEAWQQLECVYDPELGVNLVDLGLIYRLDVKDGEVQVEMTLTTPGCPMSDSMPGAVERALLTVPWRLTCSGRGGLGAAMDTGDDVRARHARARLAVMEV